MKYYFVAKTPTSGFIGQLTIEDIAANLRSNQIREDYVATESTGHSYAQLMKTGGVRWVAISELLADEPVVSPTVTTVAATHAEFIERRSGWATFLRVVGGVNILVGLVGFLAIDDKRVGGLIFAVGLV